ncbi:protein toll-like [Haliotis rufescens]|uniref:protein toll-like n=1 Tax=Haliotis rufescens TaxID=6454 RepID=UPI00201FB162|nr:protein toll-like [Haliotis rufescens]
MLVSLLYVILAGLSILSTPVSSIQRCQVAERSFNISATYMIHKTEKRVYVHTFVIQSVEGDQSNDTECFIEAADVFKDEQNYSGSRIRAYAFLCGKPTNIIINGTYPALKEVISYVQIQNCDLSLESLNIIANTTSVTVLNIVWQSALLASSDPRQCAALDGVGTLMISNKRYPSLDMEVFFACKDHLSFMAEMILRNLSLTELPAELFQHMPTLQGLDLSVNNFTIPPEFPWDNSTRDLPRNLTRTTFFQNQYTYGIVEMSAREYRREFRLDYNPHLNLTGYNFRGYLQMLSLEGCNLESLQPGVFYEVDGLQYLNLAQNQLESIPPGLFQKASELRKLELQGNKLTELQAGVFQGLHDLVRLDLSNNGLSLLGDRLFDGLFKLEKLDLKNNKLTHINSNAFSKLLVNLKVVDLENNPLTHIPESLLLLRSLYDIRMKGHNITDLDFSKLDHAIPYDRLKYTLVDSVSNGNPDLDRPSDGLRAVDLSDGSIQTISFTPADKYTPIKISLLLKHYKFILHNNPIRCDCNILNFTTYVRELKENGSIAGTDLPVKVYGTEFAYDAWTCSQPQELSGRKVLLLEDDETYCLSNTTQCPLNCSCYERSISRLNIVDCRGIGLTEAPKTLPPGDTELWLQDNHIRNFLIGRELSQRLVELNLERNGLEKLNPTCLSHMGKLERLYIQDNVLANIPPEIQEMNLKSIKLGGNPLQCDCHSLWMKQWLVANHEYVEDSFDVKCVNFVEDIGRNIFAVPDGDFICEEIPIHKVAVPIAVPTVIVLFMLVLSLVLFIHWDDFKVFLYVHTGIHPFDKKDPSGIMCYDAFVVYPAYLSDWAQENVVNPLKTKHRYKVYDVANDFKFGHSLQENIQHGVALSKRIVLVLGEQSESDSMMQIAVEAGLEKSRGEKANFLVPILHNAVPKNFDNEQLHKYFKAGKYVNESSDHFLKRLLYYMPTKQVNSQEVTETVNLAFEDQTDLTETATVNDIHVDIHKEGNTNMTMVIQPAALPQPDLVEDTKQGSTVFVWYADSDFPFMMEKIVNPMEAEGHSFILADKSFIPGAAVQENILHAVEDSDRTIIILSQESVIDEWILFVFRFASERQMVDRSFMAGMVVREGMLNVPCDEEIVKHLLAYQPLSEKDCAFHKKLRTFVGPRVRNCRQNRSQDKLNCDV